MEPIRFALVRIEDDGTMTRLADLPSGAHVIETNGDAVRVATVEEAVVYYDPIGDVDYRKLWGERA